jgi:hypothetical protein
MAKNLLAKIKCKKKDFENTNLKSNKKEKKLILLLLDSHLLD